MPAESTLRLRPLGFVTGTTAAYAIERGLALPLAGGPRAFTAVEALARGLQGETISALGTLAELRNWAGEVSMRVAQTRTVLDRLTRARGPFAGLSLDRPLLMGIVNVTPDSFSDGGAYFDSGRAVVHGQALLAAGADILDIGGESTRPGATPVAPDEEAKRILPVVRALAEAGAVVSADTRHASVMAAALGAGARIVNDVTALSGDPASPGVVARAGAAVVLMHMQGEPGALPEAPTYRDVSLDVFDYLEARLAACRRAGIADANMAVDPGIGFGKTAGHNFMLLARLSLLHGLGTCILVGASRKSFIAKASRGEGTGERLSGSLVAAISAAAQGAQILRVHDVAETRQALAILSGLDSAS